MDNSLTNSISLGSGLQQQQQYSYDSLTTQIRKLEQSNEFKDAIIDSYIALIEKQMSLIRMLSERRG